MEHTLGCDRSVFGVTEVSRERQRYAEQQTYQVDVLLIGLRVTG